MSDYPKYPYPFRYREPRTGKWRNARYRAELDVIRERYAFETTGEPMLITDPSTGTFNPLRAD